MAFDKHVKPFNEGQKFGRAHLTKSSPTKVSTALNKAFSQTHFGLCSKSYYCDT